MYVHALAGVKQKLGVERAVLATTSHFSKNTNQDAKVLGIDLWDGKKIQKMHRELVQQINNN